MEGCEGVGTVHGARKQGESEATQDGRGSHRWHYKDYTVAARNAVRAQQRVGAALGGQRGAQRLVAPARDDEALDERASRNQVQRVTYKASSSW